MDNTVVLSVLLVALALACGLLALWLWRRDARDSQSPHDTLIQTIEGLPDGCVVLDTDRRVTAHNNHLLELLPAGVTSLNGVSADTLYNNLCLDTTRVTSHLHDWLSDLPGDKTSSIEVLDHQHRHLLIRERPTSNGGVTSVIRDISDTAESRRQLRIATEFDTLTGLANRVRFLAKLRECMAVPGATVGLAVCDLRDFRQINDSYGQDVGDQVLVAVADALLRAMPEKAVVARNSGDEFAVVIADQRAEAMLTQALTRFLADLKRGVPQDILKEDASVPGNAVPLRASVGVAVAPQHGGTPVALKNAADSACAQAKREGSGTYAVYDRQIQEVADRAHLIEIGLIKAIERNELEIEYQPQIDIKTNMTAGMEALIRWDSRTLGRVSPAEFIPRAEQCGLVGELGGWVLRKSIADYQRLMSVGTSPGTLSVNISRRQFDSPTLPVEVADVLSATGMNPALLTLEITETAILDNRHKANDILAALHSLGVNLSIDDFGVGYSSFMELRDFPINEVKIDRTFIRDVVSSTNDQKIIGAIVDVAETIGAEVVAEGIETREQFDIIRTLGCHRAQGYFLCEPMRPTPFPDVVLGGASTAPA